MRIDLVTAHTRSLIYRACRKPGDHWKGTRKGVKIVILLTDQPTLEGDRVRWSARFRKTWESGDSQDIRAAIDTIEHRAAAEAVRQRSL